MSNCQVMTMLSSFTYTFIIRVHINPFCYIHVYFIAHCVCWIYTIKYTFYFTIVYRPKEASHILPTLFNNVWTMLHPNLKDVEGNVVVVTVTIPKLWKPFTLGQALLLVLGKCPLGYSQLCEIGTISTPNEESVKQLFQLNDSQDSNADELVSESTLWTVT